MKSPQMILGHLRNREGIVGEQAAALVRALTERVREN
jgi:hypothetical protein